MYLFFLPLRRFSAVFKPGKENEGLLTGKLSLPPPWQGLLGSKSSSFTSHLPETAMESFPSLTVYDTVDSGLS